MGQIYIQGITKAVDLLSDDGTKWNEEKVEAKFTPTDALDIKQIAIGGPGAHDFLAWNFTKNDIFTVKSAYHLRMSLNRARTGQPKASSFVSKHKGDMALWETSALAQVKIHMW